MCIKIAGPYLSHIIYDDLSFRITHGNLSSRVGPSHTVKSRVSLYRNAGSWYLSHLKYSTVKSFIKVSVQRFIIMTLPSTLEEELGKYPELI